MRENQIFKRIMEELKHHAPFTIFGALTGIIIVFFFHKMPSKISYNIFYTLHPIHVVLSALVTASMYGLHECGCLSGKCLRGKCNLWALLLIGYVGAIGIATLSDSLIPYLGEVLLGLSNRHVHIGFIEEWYIVNPMALLGVGIAYFKPATKIPHSGHVLLSTWASLFHVIMALGQDVSWYVYVVIFVFLFLAVWIPCCISDIIFPLLFVRNKK